jgi:hypothetical protein
MRGSFRSFIIIIIFYHHIAISTTAISPFVFIGVVLEIICERQICLPRPPTRGAS